MQIYTLKSGINLREADFGKLLQKREIETISDDFLFKL